MKKMRFEIKPVEMCIYIDKHIYEENHDTTKIFEYLECLFYSLSVKKKLFKTQEDYDNFKTYAATEVYLRLTNKKQFLQDDDPKKLKKIKSILNYIKRVLYPLTVNYQQENYCNLYKQRDLSIYKEQEGSTQPDKNSFMYENTLNSNSEFIHIEVDNYLNSICKIIRSVTDNTIYSKDKILTYNIYMSCLLTLLKSFTLSKYNTKRITNENGDMRYVSDKTLESIYYEESSNALTVWNLDESMSTFISVLVNKIKRIIAKEIRDIINYYQPSEELIKDILFSSIQTNEEEEEND